MFISLLISTVIILIAASIGLSRQVFSLTFWSMKLLRQRNVSVCSRWTWRQKRHASYWPVIICRFAYLMALLMHSCLDLLSWDLDHCWIRIEDNLCH